MKKIVLIAVLLLAAPAMAAVNFTLVPEANSTGIVAINYDASGEGELVRAFALDISVDSGASIEAITDYTEGVSVSGDKGYGIFPGSIDINDAGDINDVGTPVGDPCQLPSDTLPGLGKAGGITIEMGSLYVGGPNAPDASGLLCKVEVSADCNLTVTANVSRGEVVMEGATQATTNLPQQVAVTKITDCLKITDPGYDAWVNAGKPECWCYRRHCRGEADGIMQGPFWVASYDLTLLKGAINKIVLPPGGICADFDHEPQGPFRVGSYDLAELKLYINKLESQVPECDDTHINFWTN